MAHLDTRHFGSLEFDGNAIFDFPRGIPGFEGHRQFVFVAQPHMEPLLFMQSVSDPALRFIAMPVFVADPGYELELLTDEREALGLAEAGPLHIGADLACLALVTTREGSDPTVNLASPIVVNLRSRQAVQAPRNDSRYSLRHRLLAETEVEACS